MHQAPACGSGGVLPFIDSIFRDYPVPAFFLFVVEGKGLEDQPVKKFEVVDGQQRLIALRDFRKDKISLFEVKDDSKLKLPKSVRQMPAPWAGRRYSELRDELKQRFDRHELTIFEIGASAIPDEVRDLFIRLQSGTALTRQQIRDAWPGNLGPFIENIAGKLDQPPKTKFFEVIDMRGARSDDDDRDEFVANRQLAAQLLAIFLAHDTDPGQYASVTANELDNLYHARTDWDSRGPTAQRFYQILEQTGRVFKLLRALDTTKKMKRKFRRVDVTVIMLYLQDLTKNERVKIDDKFLAKIAIQLFSQSDEGKPTGGKAGSPSLLKATYDWWRERSPDKDLIRLDQKRTFDDVQKQQIRSKADNKCQICQNPIPEGQGEFDHFPVAYRDGGVTEVSNGRLVCASCHPRGRPPEESND
jgi:hypothetical protein